MALNGSFREEQGFTAYVRLEVEGVDRQTGDVSAVIGSRTKLSVHREFTGHLDPSGSAILFTATERGSFHADEDFDVPFLKRPAPATLRLGLAGNAVTGVIEGDPAWKIEFPVGTFLSAPIEAEAGGPLPHPAAPYPEFPREDGAYLLRNGGWLALPKNQGHVVEETIKPDSNLHLSLNIIDLLGEGAGLVSREKEKKTVHFFQFEGKDPRPVIRGEAVSFSLSGRRRRESPR